MFNNITPRPLKYPPATTVSPSGVGGRSPSDGLPPGGGGGCKGISRQTVVPSTEANKQNTSEATFALMLCQCDSCNTDIIGGAKEW